MQQSIASYNKPDVVQQYTSLKNLFPPEAVLFQLLDDKLADMDILDIGIGGGRTTRHLIHKAKSYTGVDFAASMITYCRQAFPAHQFPGSTFLEMDARRLQFNDASFDFVLFSFNGIDSVNEDGRLQILKEVNRVLRKGGIFIFSFHNIQSVERMFKLQLPKNPFNWPAELKRYKSLQRNNPPVSSLLEKDFAPIKDGVNHDYDLEVMYIKPAYQWKKLQEIGFHDISFYDFRGKPVNEVPEALGSATDYWIHIMCRR
ncbi:class I SAM-dependent methyltransferase [Chitinophagaceae bacterium MMS25-I14]